MPWTIADRIGRRRVRQQAIDGGVEVRARRFEMAG
jgi:hypothetical protein